MKYVVSLNGKNYEVEVNECEAVITNVSDTPVAAAPVASAPVAPAPAAAPAPSAATASGVQVVSPMPGTILSVKVQSGQSVKAGEPLFVLEAMKMEYDIVAPQDGVVKQILVEKGAAVETDAVLAII